MCAVRSYVGTRVDLPGRAEIKNDALRCIYRWSVKDYSKRGHPNGVRDCRIDRALAGVARIWSKRPSAPNIGL